MDSIAWPIEAIPRIVVAGRFALADRAHGTRYRGATHALHVHGYPATMRFGDEERRLAPGDVTLSPAEQPSSYALERPGLHWCVHFSPVSAEGERVALPLHLTGESGHVVEQMAHIAALHTRARDSAVARASAGLALQALLLGIAAPPAVAPSAAERAAALIEDRFAEPLDVAAIAAAVGRAPAPLARTFRARFGTTITHRLIARRVEHARYLLESTDLPIWRVAERVGIPDPQHFNKSVRRLLGASPSAIRARSAAAAIDPDR